MKLSQMVQADFVDLQMELFHKVEKMQKDLEAFKRKVDKDPEAKRAQYALKAALQGLTNCISILG